MWFIGVEVEQETSAPPPKKNPGSAPVSGFKSKKFLHESSYDEVSGTDNDEQSLKTLASVFHLCCSKRSPDFKTAVYFYMPRQLTTTKTSHEE